MSSFQKIQCTVTECAHNCLEDSTCRLDKILVSHELTQNHEDLKDKITCSMYSYSGNLNVEGAMASKQV